jgi:nucleoside-diphosphate-sugar epimerase
MKIFVTGGAGFIGRHAVKELLDGGHSLFVLTRNVQEHSSSWNTCQNIRTIQGDLSDLTPWKREVEHFQPQAVLHMAWEGIPHYDYKTSTKNLLQGLALITFAAEIGCERFICTGTLSEYADKSGKLHEDSPIQPNSHCSFTFTAAKNALHWMGSEIARENNMNFIWTRLFFVYGPGQRKDALIPYLSNSIRSGNRPNVRTLYSKNDFVYVEDVARALRMILEKDTVGYLYNIGSGYSTQIRDIIKIVYDIYGLKETDITENEPLQNEDPVDFWADISRIRNDLHWEPRYDIKAGIKKTLNLYK